MSTTIYPALAKLIEAGNRLTISDEAGHSITVAGDIVRMQVGQVQDIVEPTNGEDAAQRFLFAAAKFLSAKHLRAYIEDGATGNCPYCGSFNLDPDGTWRFGMGEVSQHYTCADCKRIFTDIYSLAALKLDDGSTHAIATPASKETPCR